MLTVRSGSALALVAAVSLLAGMEATVGVAAAGWVVGLACAAVLNLAVGHAVSRRGLASLGPADLVTLTRATLSCAVAALVADTFVRRPAVAALVTLAAVALVLDAVDGRVARRTRTGSSFGARFDGEADAFLILVLSVYVARPLGWWVLTIGLARYAFGAAGWGVPWMRRELPPRYWRKVVCATQGVVLVVVAAGVLPPVVAYAAVGAALALLAESFGRDVLWLWRHRSLGQPVAAAVAGKHLAPVARLGRRRGAVDVLANALALLLVWFALVAPNRAYGLGAEEFLRIPLEGLVVAGLAVVLPTRGRRAMAAVVGVLLGLLALVKILDMGFFAALDRPFNPVTDRGFFGPAVDLLTDSVGAAAATAVVVAAVVLVLAVLVCMPLSVGRLTAVVARHRRGSTRTLTALAVVWVLCALAGLQVGQGQPVAATSASGLAVGEVRAIVAGAGDQERFDAAVAVDAFAESREREVLAGLRGKDVVIAFVESYGRISLDGLPSSPEVRAVLDDGSRRLRAAGFTSRSAFLTSPTFGGISWLAHATLQSGLWVDNQPRYDRLLSGDRMTLSRLFGQEGWRTVAFMPSNDSRWPAGKEFYRFDKIWGWGNIPYAGPRFGFSNVPDQYALHMLHRLELARRDRKPVMAQVDLASSHTPWAPLPRLVPWDQLGDGSVYHRVYAEAEPATELWANPERFKDAYVTAIVYTLESLISFVEEHGDEDLVLVVLGDHQPAAVVSGHGASRDVPVTVVAHDPAVIERITGWDWARGMRPGLRAPVWRMDDFRDRFLAAYSTRPASPGSRPAARR